MNALIPLPQQAHDIGAEMLDALDNMNLMRETQDGHVFGVSFSEILIYGNRHIAYAVDTKRLPTRISRLADAETALTLSARIHKPVRALVGEHGMMYVVRLAPRDRVMLPQMVPLSLGGRPRGDYMIPIGTSAAGPVWRDLRTMGDILVGGLKGSGKSNLYHTWLAALLSTETPDTLRIVLIDPKRVEFSFWAKAPHLYWPVANTVEEAGGATTEILHLVETRLRAFASVPVQNLDEYNAHQVHCGQPTMPRVVMLIDEFVELAVLGGLKSRFYSNLLRLTSMARAAGVTLILAATNPKADVVDTLARDNCDARIAFRCTTSHQSRSILLRSGAEQLPPAPGRMLVSLPDLRAPVEMQSFYLEPQALRDVAARVCGGSSIGTTDSVNEIVSTTDTLTDDEHAVIAVLLTPKPAGLDGVFTVRSAYEKLAGKVRRNRIADISRTWGDRGWLKRLGGQNEGQAPTEKLFSDLGLAFQRVS